MITKESLRAETLLKDLGDDQLSRIIDLVTNRIGELHGGYDQDLSEATGITKPPGSGSSYSFWKDKVKSIVSEKKELEGKLTELESSDKTSELQETINALQEQIKAGKGDQGLVTQLEKEKKGLEQQLNAATSKYETTKQQYDSLVQEQFADKVNSKIDGLIGEFTIKDGVSDYVKGLAVKDVKQFLSSNYELDLGSVEGKEILVLKKDGNVVGDSPKELIAQQMKEVIGGREQKGSGGTPPPPGSGSGAGLSDGVVSDAAQAKSKVEATKIIQDHLRANNIATNDPKYQQIMDKTFSEVVPENLPLR